jgi:Phytanoyl-CoA dioxygenase (PhyH)
MITVHTISGALDDERRRELIYGGDLIVYTGVPAMGELAARTDALLREALGVPDPPLVHQHLDTTRLAELLAPLRQRYRQDEEVAALTRAALEQVGVPLEPTFWDGLFLRSLPDGAQAGEGRGIAPTRWHRDTWSSNVYAQSNWWAPIYPVAAGRTITFHPTHWLAPTANTSGSWDLEEIKAKRSRGEPVELVAGLSEPVDERAELRVVMEPGDLLCFSGAHLHASVPNRTGLTRFSVEVRTVDARDVAAGRGAPNVDGAAPRVALHWFKQVQDGRALP